MIAYNNKWLDNILIQQELENACSVNLISKEEKKTAGDMYPSGFYTPDFFIRVGLFILTVVIVSFSMGLVSLIFLNSMQAESIFAALLIFFGMISYGLLEVMVQHKHHYNSGVDDALLWMCGAGIVGGLNMANNISASGNSVIIFIIAFYFLLRFANAVMGVLVVLSLLSIVLLTCSKLGVAAKTTAPFLLMLLAFGIYFFGKKLSLQTSARHYKNSLILIQVMSLIAVYTAVNYFVVREASVALFNLTLTEGEGIPFGWLFWFFTFFIPCVYIFRGIQKKDVVLLRVGLLLVVAIVFTVRYYHSILPAEIAMTVGGLLLTALAYALIKYLQQPKYGFTYQTIYDKHLPDKINIEALVIAETFSAVQPADASAGFGGGSFGGGGASGDY